MPRVPTATEEYIAYECAMCARCEASSCDSPPSAGAAAWGASPEAEVPWGGACPCSPVSGADPREAFNAPSFAETSSPRGAGAITAACSIEAGAAGAFTMFATVAGFAIRVWNHPFSTNGLLNQKENEKIASTTSGTHMFGGDSWAWSNLWRSFGSP